MKYGNFEHYRVVYLDKPRSLLIPSVAVGSGNGLSWSNHLTTDERLPSVNSNNMCSWTLYSTARHYLC